VRIGCSADAHVPLGDAMPHPERGRSRHELRSKYAVVVKVRLYPRDLGKPLLFHLWLMRFDNNPPTIAQKNPCHAPDARMVKESPFRGRQKIADGACAASTGDNLPAA